MVIITLPKLLELIKEDVIPSAEKFEFSDNHHQRWGADLEMESFVNDDSIPEELLSNEDYEDVPHCKIYCFDNCYLEFSSVGDDNKDALLQCLYYAELISEETFRSIAGQNHA